MASGPSLDNQLENLKKLSSQYSIVACGSSLGTLFKNKIKVSAYVNLEMESLVYDDLYKLATRGTASQELNLLRAYLAILAYLHYLTVQSILHGILHIIHFYLNLLGNQCCSRVDHKLRMQG